MLRFWTSTKSFPKSSTSSMTRRMSSDSKISVFTTLKALREWRRENHDKSIGFVPTMGALHAGHISLVKRSLAQNDLTVVSIFVNPAQFAPHEDLATYPKTFDADMNLLRATSVVSQTDNLARTAAAVFLPSVADMYPSGIAQDVSEQKGTFIEVKGFSHQMEGKSRPTFFRGVATVVTKLFNAVEPTRAYFGQKDIQQALLLRRLTADLLLSHPTPSNLIIVPTHRIGSDNLALSSRNVYLTTDERPFAGTLYAALDAAKQIWEKEDGSGTRDQVVAHATALVEQRIEEAAKRGVFMKLDYIEVNDPETFEVVDWTRAEKGSTTSHHPVIVSGALIVGKTRLIDNLLCGDWSKYISE